MTDNWTVRGSQSQIERGDRSGPGERSADDYPQWPQAVVVVSADEWERKTKRVGTLAEFFASSPLRGSGLKVKRSKDKLRSSDL